MKNNSNPLSRLLNKVNSIVILVLLLLLSTVIDGTIIYGVSNSSLVINELQVRETQNVIGKMFRLSYDLSSESEASKLSLVDPINDFNYYRAKEIGRNVSYVLNEWYEATYNDISFSSSYIAFDDYFEDQYSHNRFQLEHGSFKDLDKEGSVYISRGFMAKMGDVNPEEIIGTKIKLSFNQDIEYTIGGIIDENNYNDSGIHFSRLFDPSYIVLNRDYMYKYGYTNLLFASVDFYLDSDLLDFINAYNKSYLKHENALVKVSTYRDWQHVDFPLSFSQQNKGINRFYSAISITVLAISLITFIGIILFYDFNKTNLAMRIPICVVLFSFLFLSVLFVVEQLKRSLFIPNLSMVLFIAFIVISIIAYMYAFSFFHHGSEHKVEETNNG